MIPSRSEVKDILGKSRLRKGNMDDDKSKSHPAIISQAVSA